MAMLLLQVKVLFISVCKWVILIIIIIMVLSMLLVTIKSVLPRLLLKQELIYIVLVLQKPYKHPSSMWTLMNQKWWVRLWKLQFNIDKLSLKILLLILLVIDGMDTTIKINLYSHNQWCIKKLLTDQIYILYIKINSLSKVKFHKKMQLSYGTINNNY